VEGIMEISHIIKIISYIGWILTTAVGIVGSYFYNYTTEIPGDITSKALTSHGKLALILIVISFFIALVSSVYNEYSQYKSSIKEIEYKENLKGQISLLTRENQDLNESVTQVLRKQGIWQLAKSDKKLNEFLLHIQKSIPGRADVREKLNEKNDQDFKFGSIAILTNFQLRLLGKNRSDESFENIAGVLIGLESDIIFLQEILDVEALMFLKKYLPHYEVRWFNMDKQYLSSGSAMLYRKSSVELLNEPIVIGKPNEFYRNPIAQTIKIGNQILTVVNIHIKWGDNLKIRRQELTGLLDYLNKLYNHSKLIIAGAFQLKSQDQIFQKFFDAGYFMPDFGNNNSDLKYNNFLLSNDISNLYIENSAEILKIKDIFSNFEEKDIRKTVSDHNPLNIVLDIN
jgi:cell division protein FtsL